MTLVDKVVIGRGQFLQKYLTFFSLLILLISSTACKEQVPQRVGGWRIEVGPPGNEFYRAPAQAAEEVPPPSHEMFLKVKAIAPEDTEIKRWEYQRNERYFIRAETGPEEYDFRISKNGELVHLDYENDVTNVYERPGALILSGTKKSIEISQVPQKTLRTLRTTLPDAEPTDAWSVDTPAGPRYVLVLGPLAIYSRVDGQIQALGLVENGALGEIDPATIKSKEEVAAEAIALLSPYQDKFNFEKQIQKLLQNQKRQYRFVVIGDSRSNPDLWVNITKHIDQLDPKPEFVINTGDIVPRGYTNEYLEYYIPPLLETDIPFFVALGNHDNGDDAVAIEYRTLFGDNSLNYHFDYSRRRFIFIDNVTSVTPYENTLAWLKRVLEETPQDHQIIVAAHRPIATVEKWAYHSWDPENSRTFAKLMSNHNVEHVFFGHIHAYSTAVLDGISYTICGGGGAGLHDRYGPLGNVHHYLICDVRSDGSMDQQVVRFYKVDEEKAG
jgi:hypothetical protein